MDIVLDVLTALLLSVGCFLGIIGAIGLHRLPDFFTRQHATGVTDSACATAILVALMLQAGFTMVTVKLCFILVFLVITSSTATHALAKTALLKGLQPLVGRGEKR